MTWVTPEKEIQNGAEAPKTQEPNEGTPKTDYEARHKEAQDALSRKAEENIKANIKLAKLDPKEIVDMDSKMQNKVISELYGYNNIEELKLIQGEEFWKGEEEKDFNETETLAQKIKILEYQNKKSDVARALENYQKDNAKIFEDNPDALEKIEGEIAYISDSLPVKERVERAGKILFGNNYVDNTTATYLSMQDKSMGSGGNANRSTDGTKKDNSFADFAKAGGFIK